MPRYEIHWKDFNSPLARNEIWVGLSYLWPTLLRLPFVPFGIRSEKDAISYFTDLRATAKAQSMLMERMTHDPRELSKLIALSEKWARELNRYTATVARTDLCTWSVKKLKTAFETFARLQERQYAIGVPLVAFDTSFGPTSLDHAVQKIFERLPTKMQSPAYAAFTMPTRDSFSREQEKAFLEIYVHCKRFPRVMRILTKHSPQEIPGLLPQAIARLLMQHTKRWAWVYYAYAGPAWTEGDFAAVLKDWALRRVSPAQLFAQWEKERNDVARKQKKYLAFFPVTQKEKDLLRLVSLVVWSKPRRKDYQSKSYWHMERWYREVARRLGISLREVRSMPQAMLWTSLQSGRVDRKKIQELYAFHVVAPGARGPVVLSGKKARRFLKTVYEEKIEVKGREWIGSSACPGKARGVVRIINSAEDISKMQEGDILVSVATTPSIVSAMRKAAAILTDEGGLTCHAAIVSRELNIPCVVGLKVITTALSDGDRVEWMHIMVLSKNYD